MTSTLLEVQFPHKMNLVRRSTTTTTTSSKSNGDAELLLAPTTTTTTTTRKATAAGATFTIKTHHRSEPYNDPAEQPQQQQHQEHPERVVEEKRKRTNGQDGYTVHKYLIGRMLGKGGFAKVYLCTALDTGKNYAVKVVPKENLVKPRAKQKLHAEIRIHRELKHRYVCQYKHYFEDEEYCYILLELCQNQSLNEMIKRRKNLTEPEAAYFMKQLVEATRYMHSVNVIHRDLKLGNLFLDGSMTIKVGDLGLATKVSDKDEKRKTICGTPNYIAPEIIQSDKALRGHSFEVDIWSMGVILYTLLVGKPPYEAKDVKATYQRILNNEYSFPRHVEVSNAAKSLIRSMLQSKPADRPTLDEVDAHPFLNEHNIPLELPSSVLSLVPDWRINEAGEMVCYNHHHNHGTVEKQLNGNGSKNAFGLYPRGGGGTNRQPFVSHDFNKNAVQQHHGTNNEAVNIEKVTKSVLSGQKSLVW